MGGERRGGLRRGREVRGAGCELRGGRGEEVDCGRREPLQGLGRRSWQGQATVASRAGGGGMGGAGEGQEWNPGQPGRNDCQVEGCGLLGGAAVPQAPAMLTPVLGITGGGCRGRGTAHPAGGAM